MYRLIFTSGGLLIMMGQHARSETLFYYFTLEEYIPQNHLVRGDKLSVDGSFVEANAAKESRIPREQLAEAVHVNHTLRQHHIASIAQRLKRRQLI